MYLNLLLRSSADELATRKEEYDNLRLVHSIDQTWKLFGLVHCLLQPVGRLLQVDVAAEACGSDYVLDLNVGLAENDDSIPLQLVYDFQNGLPRLTL